MGKNKDLPEGYKLGQRIVRAMTRHRLSERPARVSQSYPGDRLGEGRKVTAGRKAPGGKAGKRNNKKKRGPGRQGLTRGGIKKQEQSMKGNLKKKMNKGRGKAGDNV